MSGYWKILYVMRGTVAAGGGITTEGTGLGITLLQCKFKMHLIDKLKSIMYVRLIRNAVSRLQPSHFVVPVGWNLNIDSGI